MKIRDPDISYFAQVDFRDRDDVFGQRQFDRMYGLYSLGKTGSGKTNLMESLLKSDLKYGNPELGRGVAIFDVNGDMIKKIQGFIPKERLQDCIYIDTSDPNLSWGYNPLRNVSYEYRHLVASNIIETFQKMWGQQAWGIKLEHILRNVCLTLLDQKEASFVDIARILTDKEFRSQCVSNVVSEEVKNFWMKEFPKFSKGDILPVLNKVGGFITIPMIKKILVENKRQLSFGDAMNKGKIILINLSKGTLGVDASHLLGSLLLNSISSAGFSRINIPEKERKPFFVYIDEFQNYTTLSLVNMFSELRKFAIGFIIAHQYLGQLNPKIRDAVLGNVGTIISFRVSYQDAKYLAQEFYPVFSPHDLISLENYHIYLKMMIDGKISKPFSAKTIDSKLI